MSSRAVRRCRRLVHGYALPYRLDLLTAPTTAYLEDVPEPRRERHEENAPGRAGFALSFNAVLSYSIT
jgi:hypothetical protein